MLALELPLKVLVWQSDDGRVWVSSPRVDYLETRYAVPAALITNIVGVDPLIEGALRS